MTTQRRLLLLSLLLATLLPRANAEPAGTPDTSVETIVFIRHGEKPPEDLGQLTFQGLNRALALPEVLISKYGKADFIFAPCTTKLVHAGIPYSYVRPLITIEPTAILLGLPIEAKFSYDDIGGLQKALSEPVYRSSVIFVAWEHRELDDLVKNMLGSFGADPAIVPKWPGGDFDSIYVVRIRTQDGKRTASFTHDYEGLNGESSRSPEPARQ